MAHFHLLPARLQSSEVLRRGRTMDGTSGHLRLRPRPVGRVVASAPRWLTPGRRSNYRLQSATRWLEAWAEFENRWRCGRDHILEGAHGGWRAGSWRVQCGGDVGDASRRDPSRGSGRRWRGDSHHKALWSSLDDSGDAEGSGPDGPVDGAATWGRRSSEGGGRRAGDASGGELGDERRMLTSLLAYCSSGYIYTRNVYSKTGIFSKFSSIP